MPELPEVEVSRLGITPHLVGCTIERVVVRQRQLRWPIPDEVMSLTQAPILGVTRRAKYLLIHVSHGAVLLHLGMSGSLRVIDASLPPAKHDHLDILLSSGKALRFNDPRRFGMCLWQAESQQHSLLVSLGPEPLTDEFDAQRLIELAKGKKSAVKNFIMDNKVVVGVGNIYANEALFMAGIHPKRQAGRVSAKRYALLTDCIKQVLAKAIEQGGTTLKDFSQANGQPGYFKQELAVYGRAGEECVRCGDTIVSATIGQRNTFFCNGCQS